MLHGVKPRSSTTLSGLCLVACFATLKAKDGANDRASRLNRSNVFRFNIGISKATYEAPFGRQPARPPAGTVVDSGHDFAALDVLLPHPVYGWMAWISVLNPSPVLLSRLNLCSPKPTGCRRPSSTSGLLYHEPQRSVQGTAASWRGIIQVLAGLSTIPRVCIGYHRNALRPHP